MSSAGTKYVLFDLDGTLADTAPDLADSLNQVLHENQRPPLPLEQIRPSVSQGGIFMLKMAFGMEDNDPRLNELRERFLQIYRSRLSNKTGLFDGMAELLDLLDDKQTPWGIVTNKSERLTLPLIDALKLSNRTQCIVAGDTLEYSKPHPAPMLHACTLLGCDPGNTLFLGDAKKDIEAGNRAGMITLIASYGYIGQGEKIEEWEADGVIDSPLEVMDWLN